MSNIEHPAAYEAATLRNIINNASKTFYRTYPDAPEIVQFLGVNYGKNSFLTNLLDSLNTYGKLTEKQVMADANPLLPLLNVKHSGLAKLLRKT